MNTIDDLWKRLEAWAGANAPEMLKDLNPGADAEALERLASALGRELPAAYLASLRIHNGENDGWPNLVFADLGAYLPAERVVEHWQMHQQIASQVGIDLSDDECRQQIEDGIIVVDGPVQPRTFDPAWVPIMDCNGDVFWALDFAPAAGGMPGQVIQVDLEGCEWKLIATSFDEFLANYVAALEAGDYAVEDGRATRDPAGPEAAGRIAVRQQALESAPAADDIGQLPAGARVDIVGVRTGRVKGDRCLLAIRGGAVRLRGSLRGANFNQPLKVTIRIGARRGFGLLGPVHEILDWAFVE